MNKPAQAKASVPVFVGKENPRLSRGFKKALAMERKRPPVL
jgi:hypothetical protein